MLSESLQGSSTSRQIVALFIPLRNPCAEIHVLPRPSLQEVEAANCFMTCVMKLCSIVALMSSPKHLSLSSEGEMIVSSTSSACEMSDGGQSKVNCWTDMPFGGGMACFHAALAIDASPRP